MPDRTDKTFEWMPHTNALLGSTDINAQFGVSWFGLETAINTYSDLETGHKIFDLDTDLNYPPNLTRFLNFLGDTVLAAIAYLARLIAVTRSYVPDLQETLSRWHWPPVKQLIDLAAIQRAFDAQYLRTERSRHRHKALANLARRHRSAR